MFYVIGSEYQSRVLLCTAPANRTKGVVEQFGTSGVPIPCRMKPTYGGTLVFSCLCSGLPLHHYYTDTSLIRQDSECLSLYSEFQKAIFNGSRKISFCWLGHLGVIYQRVYKNFLHIPPEKTFTFAPCTEEFTFKWSRWETLFVHSCFQMVAGETKLFMRASSAIFQNVSSSGSRWDWRFGEWSQKKTLPVVADEKGIFRSISRKNSKK